MYMYALIIDLIMDTLKQVLFPEEKNIMLTWVWLYLTYMYIILIKYMNDTCTNVRTSHIILIKSMTDTCTSYIILIKKYERYMYMYLIYYYPYTKDIMYEQYMYLIY